MKLYEIDEAMKACYDEETGKLLNPEALAVLIELHNNKIERLCNWVKELNIAVEAFEARQRVAELLDMLNDVYCNSIKKKEAQNETV